MALYCSSGIAPVELIATVYAQPGGNAALDIPATSLRSAVATLARQRGVSIGYEGRLPNSRVAGIKGSISTEAALARLLAGTGLTFERLGPRAYRIVRTRAVDTPAIASAPPDRPPPTTVSSTPIVITGKREQLQLTLPASISVLTDVDLKGGPLPGSGAVAAAMDGLALTNLGPGRNRQFIRGIADSPFNGNSQSTVAIYVGDARVTYNAPDPDLRLVDVERVEVLKGPQGPLYGTGALGGVYRLEPHAPVFGSFEGAASLAGDLLSEGGVGGSGNVVINVPLGEDVAVRAAAYAAREPGWIDNVSGPEERPNANDARVRGLRLGARARPATGWTIDLTGLAQLTDIDDSQYVTDRASLSRRNRYPEPHDSDFLLAALGVRGGIGALDLVSSTSFVRHEVETSYDASASADKLGGSAPLLFRDSRLNQLFDQEIRLSQSNPSGLSWVVGASYLHTRSRNLELLTPANGGTERTKIGIRQSVDEFAAFAELTLPLGRDLTVTGGARLFRNVARNRQESETAETDQQVRKTGLSPSIALGWHVGDDDYLFLRYAGALRPGGLAPSEGDDADAFDADELQAAELGYRHQQQGLRLEAAVFWTLWSHLQSDYLLESGLISTRNAGKARILGAEASLSWTVDDWILSAGGTVQDARLIEPDISVSRDHPALPVVPGWRLRAAVERQFAVGDWRAAIGARAVYQGEARLSFDPGLDREIDAYGTTGLDFRLGRAGWSIEMTLENLFDSRSDTFGFGNPFSVREVRQFVPLAPRRVTLALGVRW